MTPTLSPITPGSMSSSNPSVGQRPLSKAESANPREFQINQLRRRFHPTETSDESGTTFAFGLAPSDPDFPFDLDKLQCALHVPTSYPSGRRPTLKVANPEMEKAFQDNVSRGFDDIVDSTLRTGGRGTLLTWMNTLDRHLERLLTTTERGPTLKFVTNVNNKANEAPATREIVGKLQSLPVPLEGDRKVTATTTKPKPPARVFSAEEKAQAEKRRALETRQIEARLGRLPLFQKSKDELSFVIPIQPPKAERLPPSLRSVKTVKLLVPSLYPLEHSAVELRSVDSIEARAVEAGFAQWVTKNLNLNLMSQVNYLTSNMHNFAKTPLEEASDLAAAGPGLAEPEINERPPTTGDVQLGDKPHVHVVPRPPEWSVKEGGDESEGTDLSTSEEYSSDEEDEEGGAPVPNLPEATPERGVAISFPFIELYGIELLDLVGLSITVKCERCKEQLDVKHVPQVKDKDDKLSPKIESCKKCANTMSFGFRRQLIHSHSNRAGYLDLDGCIIADLLPSSFIPTCAECSTSFPAPGVVAVRGENAMAGCRQCHRKMVFKLPEVKFLRVGTAAFTSRDQAPQRKKPKEVLGIVAGQELPRRGRCMHYGKSFRWFRFSCCAKVFPCDKCHDAAEDHPNEHANRMICGFCSREQIYRPEDCGICRAVLVGKAGSGFWEGGKGTRNRVLMSRKDPRKFKRRPGSTPGGTSKKK
ncbi:CHY zinc finger domain protein [Aspergillus steynii IBT 23096]|uniref:CHY zinc finger domain protein n=1 Tax=Aspergillus steynii IBT 23096 TaxID=1392250 RepID=A0A2I2GRQ7_9EURO|nr:CHY zinc finger domain protein [Aspergillus steynii IBT 23096]PLB55560.1 CHY zinc finger domain protein [Aspergillus steynii IBT 23096]